MKFSNYKKSKSMKNQILTVLTIGWAITGTAQMEFSHAAKLEEVKAEAAKENKLIFIDAYTTWCGPCKWMVANVFPDQEVGAFYNEHFVNFKIDMEKGEGPQLAEKYHVNAYPTFLVLNASGELVHKFVGATEAAVFIENGKKALDTDSQYFTLLKRYKNGERGLAFLEKIAMAGLDASDEQSREIIQTYLDAIPESKLLSDVHHKGMVLFTATQFDSKSFQFILKNQAEFSKEHLEMVVRNCVDYSFDEAIEKKDEAALVSIKQNIQKYMGEKGNGLQDNLELTFYRALGDEKKLAEAENRILTTTTDWGLLNSAAWGYYETKTAPSDIKKALGWAKRSVELDENYFNTDTYAHLLHKVGKKKSALKWAKRAVELGKASNQDVTATEELIRSI